MERSHFFDFKALEEYITNRSKGKGFSKGKQFVSKEKCHEGFFIKNHDSGCRGEQEEVDSDDLLSEDDENPGNTLLTEASVLVASDVEKQEAQESDYHPTSPSLPADMTTTMDRTWTTRTTNTMKKRMICLPRVIQTDCGTNFMSNVFRGKCAELAIQHITSVPYHPESQGVVERFHQTLKSVLKKLYDSDNEWDKILPFALFAIRNHPNSSTGVAPFELVFGHKVRGPLEIMFEMLKFSRKGEVKVGGLVEDLGLGC
ncbi:uncharacterized protein LOC135199045 [Macrobrachium nipponense]|uniref:uncharacterized protein LOC135199045 n=1 Tax=Macrobrachium nipponense TaxID=159736 RepID=UPI0030C80C77